MFTPDSLDRLDWPLLQNGPVNLFWRKSLFEAAILDLEALNYRILRIKYASLEGFYRDVSAVLKWKEQFGYDRWNGSLDALNDGFRGEPFDSADDGAFCIEDFDLLVAEDRGMGETILDIIADQSRSYLLFGKRLIGLVQTADAKYQTEKLGGAAAHWNQAERLNSARGW